MAGKRAVAERALAILDEQFASRPFILGDTLTIADIALFAYTHRVGEGELDAGRLVAFNQWVDRFRAHPGFLEKMHPHSLDPHSSGEP